MDTIEKYYKLDIKDRQAVDSLINHFYESKSKIEIKYVDTANDTCIQRILQLIKEYNITAKEFASRANLAR